MALLPRRTALVAVLTVGAAAAFQPVLLGQAFAASGPAAPTTLAPNSSSTPQKDPVLSWSDVSGATGYQVELSKSSDFSDTSEDVTLPGGGTTATASYAVPQTLVHGAYFWRVRAVAGGKNGTWSANAQLDRAWDDSPSIAGSSPTGDATASPSDISTYPWRFAWSPIPDASSYEIEISSVPSFVTTAQDGKDVNGKTTVECITDATSFTPYTYNQTSTPDANVDNCDLSNLSVSGGDYWRVRGIDDSTRNVVRSASQKNDLECAGLPDSTGAAGDQATGTALGTPTSPGQECSLWSVAGQVPAPTAGTGNAATPGAVNGLTLNCATGTTSNYACTSTPEFSWQPVSGAKSYAVTVADDPNFTNIEHEYTTEFLSLTPRDQLADYTAGKGYYVGVQACIGDGTCGDATIKSFTKRSPVVDGLTTTKVPGGFRLAWNDLLSQYAGTVGSQSAEAENYIVELAKTTDPLFDNPVVTTIVDASCDGATTSSCYDPPSKSSVGKDQTVVSVPTSGHYLWRVLPTDLTGNIMPASNSSNAFTADLTAPTFKLTPGGAAVGGPLTITASEATTGVSTSTVHIVPVGSSSAVAGKLKAGSSGKTWAFTPNQPLVTGASYKLVVDPAVTDGAGNSAIVIGSAIRTTTKAKDNSAGWTYSSGWKTTSASGALSGSFRSASAGKSAHVQVDGSTAKLFACKAPDMGSVTVTVDGHSTTVSEHLSYTKCGVEIWHHTLSDGTSTVTVKVSKGNGNLDEVAVS